MSHENFVLDGVLYKDVNEASEKLNRCKKVIINALNMGKTSLKGIRRKRRYIVVDDIVYTSKDITKLAKEHNVKRSAIRYQLQAYGNLDRIIAKNKRKEEVAKCQGKIVNDWLLEDVAKLTKEDILSVPHCGLKTVALIKSRLYDMGLI